MLLYTWDSKWSCLMISKTCIQYNVRSFIEFHESSNPIIVSMEYNQKEGLDIGTKQIKMLYGL